MPLWSSLQDSPLVSAACFYSFGISTVAHRLLLQVCIWPICMYYNLTIFDFALFSCLSDHLYKTLPWFQQLVFIHLVSQVWHIGSFYRSVFGQSARTITWPSLTLPCFCASWSDPTLVFFYLIVHFFQGNIFLNYQQLLFLSFFFCILITHTVSHYAWCFTSICWCDKTVMIYQGPFRFWWGFVYLLLLLLFLH